MRNIRNWIVFFSIRKSITSALFLVLFFSFCTNNNSANKEVEEKTPPVERGLAGITTKALKEHVEIISDDKMEGRKAGSAGALKAADYIATCLKDMGIAPYEESYFQYFGANKELAEPDKHFFKRVFRRIFNHRNQNGIPYT